MIERMCVNNTYECRRESDRTDAWVVIGTDKQNGYRDTVAFFVGPCGEYRAKQYVGWKNSKTGGSEG